MGIKKYKYYFTKPKSVIVKDILTQLLIAGAIVIAATSPYFIYNLKKQYKKWRKYPRQKVSAVFYRLRREGLISVKKINRQIYISLTPEGRKKAGIFQINNLIIKKPKKWDKKWRLLTFDINEKKKFIREALRGKLKELGFCLFQKSIWIYPFDCSAEIDLIKDFFGLSDNEIQLIVVENIGRDDKWRKKFKL